MIGQTKFMVNLLAEWAAGDYSRLLLNQLGICDNLEKHVSSLYPFNTGVFIQELKSYFSTWQAYSGDEDYPIPDPKNIYSPNTCFWKNTSSKEKMWHKGKYAMLRRDLCKHLVKCYKEKLLIERKREAILLLEEWGSKDFTNLSATNAGICYNLARSLEIDSIENILVFLTPYFRSWSFFSGDIKYPVPSKLPNSYSAYADFYRCVTTGRLWKRSHNAKLRRKLCFHIANQLKEELIK